MRIAAAWGAATLIWAASAACSAADVSSGIEVGGKIGSYSATKCGGIVDGVEAGKSLCYT